MIDKQTIHLYPVLEVKSMLSLQVNSDKKYLFGSIQIPSFLGKSSSDIQQIADFATTNAQVFKDNGFNGVFIQDSTPGELTWDTLCNLSSIVEKVKSSVGDFPIGTQMECDNAQGILAVAKASSCSMVRIKSYVGALLKPSGIVNGQAPQALAYKIQNKVETCIFSDIFNLTGVPIGNLSLKLACEMALKTGSNGLIICGRTYEDTLSLLKEAKANCPKAFVLCGGNANASNIKEILSIADGAIVSSCLKTPDKKSWDPNKIKELVNNAK